MVFLNDIHPFALEDLTKWKMLLGPEFGLWIRQTLKYSLLNTEAIGLSVNALWGSSVPQISSEL